MPLPATPPPDQPTNPNDSFTEFYLANHDLAVACARRIVRDEHAAMDIAQVAFVNTYRNWFRLSASAPGHARAFLLRCVTNESLRRLRDKGRRQETVTDFDGQAEPRDTKRSGSKALEDYECLRLCLRELPEKKRQAWVLDNIFEFSRELIAAILLETRNNIDQWFAGKPDRPGIDEVLAACMRKRSGGN